NNHIHNRECVLAAGLGRANNMLCSSSPRHQVPSPCYLDRPCCEAQFPISVSVQSFLNSRDDRDSLEPGLTYLKRPRGDPDVRVLQSISEIRRLSFRGDFRSPRRLCLQCDYCKTIIKQLDGQCFYYSLMLFTSQEHYLHFQPIHLHLQL